MKKSFFTLVLLSAFGSVFAQNIVYNGSFELEPYDSTYDLSSAAYGCPYGWAFTLGTDNLSHSRAFDESSYAEDGDWSIQFAASGGGGYRPVKTITTPSARR
jgi:hypothetical protein